MADPGRSAVAWLRDFSRAEQIGLAAGLVGLALLAAGGWAVVLLRGQDRRLLSRLDALETRLDTTGVAPRAALDDAFLDQGPGLPIGSPAPAFALPGLYGETWTLDALRAAGKPVLLVFSDPTCVPCTALLPDLARWQREHAARLTVAVISRGTIEANRPKATEHGLTRVLLQTDREVAQAYEANGTPAAVVVGPDGAVASPLALGADALRALVARTVGAPTSALAPAPIPAAPAPEAVPSGSANGAEAAPVPARPSTSTPQIGDPAPALTLPDLEGRPMSVAGFRGEPTLVLFWNPGCGFCAACSTT